MKLGNLLGEETDTLYLELRRYHLSALVNRLLSTGKPVPFEFIINGVFLRSSLDDYLTEHGISAETTLQVEYVPAQVPPQHVTSFQHDDWVSAVDLLSATTASGINSTVDSASQRILSASYDGLLRTWSASGECIATSPALHTMAIKSAKFLSPNMVVSSSMDRSVRIWKYSESSPTSGTFTPALELYNHSEFVNRLAVHTSSQKILAASADHTLSIFSPSESSSPEAPARFIKATSSKRHKPSSSSKPVPQRGALATLKSHSHVVSDVAFAPQDHTVAYSTSWDHSLKTWDLTTARCVDTRTTSHALYSVLPLKETGLVAAGTFARHISLVDPRATASTVVAMTLRGHTNSVSSLAQGPESGGSVLASASHDGSVRVWDLRMATASVNVLGDGGRVAEPLYKLNRETVGGEERQLFSVCWDETWGIVSGGEDGSVQVHQDR